MLRRAPSKESRVRAPRLTLAGAELLDAEMIIKHAIATKPKFPA